MLCTIGLDSHFLPSIHVFVTRKRASKNAREPHRARVSDGKNKWATEKMRTKVVSKRSRNKSEKDSKWNMGKNV